MSDEIMHVSVKDLKPGKFILIDNIPCKVVEIESSAPGKHGASKVRITAIDIFEGKKKTLLKPHGSDVESPVILKKKAQVVSVSDSTAQLMDLETYETFELPLSEEFRGSIKSGTEVEIIETMSRRAIVRIIGGA